MTRGFIIVKKNGKIKLAYYTPSDSYPCGTSDSHCGQVVAAFKSGHFMDYIVKAYADDIASPSSGVKPEPKLSRDWYVKTSKNKDGFFNDYVYEYDETKDVLTVYYYGEKSLVFSRDQIPYMDYLFGVGAKDPYGEYYRIWRGLSYDAEALEFVGGTKADKTFMHLMNDGVPIAEIDARVEASLKAARIELGGGRIIDHKPENIKKRVSLLGDDGRSVYDFYFVLDYAGFLPGSRKYSLLIQTPTCRRYIDHQSYSKRGAMKRLMGLLKNDTFVDNLELTAKAFKSVEALQEDFKLLCNKDKDAQRAEIGSLIAEATDKARKACSEECAGGTSEKDLLLEEIDTLRRYRQYSLEKDGAA